MEIGVPAPQRPGLSPTCGRNSTLFIPPCGRNSILFIEPAKRRSMNKMEFLPQVGGMNKVEFLPQVLGMNKVEFLPQVFGDEQNEIPATGGGESHERGEPHERKSRRRGQRTRTRTVTTRVFFLYAALPAAVTLMRILYTPALVPLATLILPPRPSLTRPETETRL